MKAVLSKYGFLASLIVIVAIVVAHISFSAPVGSWRNLGFGSYNVLDNADPDGLYLPSAIEFDDLGHFPFLLGTPGLPLHFSLYAIAKTYYYASTALCPNGLDFIEFCAKRWQSVNAYSKIFCGIVNLACVCLFFFALTLSGLTDFEAALASALYLFSILFGVYFNKISPEGLMVLFYLACWLSLIKFTKTRQARYIILMAVFSCLAIFSKVHYLFFLPLLCIVYLLIAKNVRKIYALSIYLTSFLAMSYILSVFIDWDAWLKGWVGFINYTYGELTPTNAGQKSFSIYQSSNLIDLFLLLLSQAKTLFSSIFLLQYDSSAMPYLLLSSLPVAILGLIGIIKNNITKLNFLFYTAVFSLPIALARFHFHYFFFLTLLCSAYCSVFVCRNILKQTTKLPLAVTVASLLSLSNIIFFIYLKNLDIAVYQNEIQPFYEALDRVKYGEHVGVLASPHTPELHNIGGFYYGLGIGDNLRIIRKFDSQFVLLKNQTKETLYQNYIFAFLDFKENGYSLYHVDCDLELKPVTLP